MSKFTKGPWVSSPHPTNFNLIQIVSTSLLKTGENISIADVYASSVISNEEMEANISLISAAPELYEAAKLVLDRFNDFSPAGAMIDIPPLRKALTDALKKARGES